jgi:predicted tellurium resistance membrane protein TerC
MEFLLDKLKDSKTNEDFFESMKANVIAKYIERYRWIAYFGLIVILYVAVKMIYEGVVDHQVGILTLL